LVRQSQVRTEQIDDRLSLIWRVLSQPLQGVDASEPNWSLLRSQLIGRLSIELGDATLCRVGARVLGQAKLVLAVVCGYLFDMELCSFPLGEFLFFAAEFELA
jgi:hypothetical protein